MTSRPSRTISRRRFLAHGTAAAAAVAGGPLLPGLVRAGTARPAIVVAVNLLGGNDGLNTVIPLFAYDRYAALRPSLAVDRDSTLPLAGRTDLALHPALREIGDVFTAGDAAIVVGAGAPTDSRGLLDHEASQRSFQTARVRNQQESRSGWLGRFLDGVEPGIVPAGVDLGGGGLLLAGESTTPLSLGALDAFGLEPIHPRPEELFDAYLRIQEASTDGSFSARVNRETRLGAVAAAGVVQEKASAYEPAVAYPEDSELAFQLRDAATLIASDLGVRAIAVGMGDFDTHDEQEIEVAPGQGRHSTLLRQTSEAIAAFQADLAAHGHAERVVTVVFSEFGRRAMENGDAGTDHGLGSVMMVLGPRVKGGVYGRHPGLRDADLVLDGNVATTTDFRAVYAEVLAGHLGTDPGSVLGRDFARLGFL